MQVVVHIRPDGELSRLQARVEFGEPVQQREAGVELMMRFSTWATVSVPA